MAFLNLPLILFGSLAVFAPILLHLMLRRKPQHAVFPALRFIRKHQIVKQQRLKIQHWILLILRCLSLMAVAIALARPIISSARVANWTAIGILTFTILGIVAIWLFSRSRPGSRSISTVLMGAAGLLTCLWTVLVIRVLAMPGATVTTDSEAPVAAVLIFDASPRMGLIHESESRLERAKSLAKGVISQLPGGSRIAVMDTDIGGSAFAVDRSVALTEIKALETGYASQPVPQLLQDARRLLDEAEETQHELYVFSDLTEPSWKASGNLATEWEPSEAPNVYILDVGVKTPHNRQLGDVRLGRQHLVQNSKVDLNVEVQVTGESRPLQVELAVEQPDPSLPMVVNGKPKLPELQLRDQRDISMAGDATSQWVDFSLGGLPIGTHHGQIRLVGRDGLPIDDVRFFSVEVHPPARIAVLSGKGAVAGFLLEALAPRTLRSTGQAAFACNGLPLDQLPVADLTQYDCVAILDPPPLAPETWSRLESFADQGGGIGIFLGRNANRGPGYSRFNDAPAQRLLPGKLEPPWRAGRQEFLYSIGATEHPMLRLFQRNATAVPWHLLPIERHWQMDQLNPSARVILRFSNGQPAVLERTIGLGKIMVTTTPFSDPLNVRGRPAWNRGTDEWPFVVLVNEIFKYLANGDDSSLNYSIEQSARLVQRPNDPSGLQWFRPEGAWQDALPSGNEYSIPVRVPGTYRLKGSPDARGFSANVAAYQSNLNRIAGDRLDAVFGEGGFQIADDKDSIHRKIGVARHGHEFYPYVILFVAFTLALEHLLSNRFYAVTGQSAPIVAP